MKLPPAKDSAHFSQRRCNMNTSILSGQEALRLRLHLADIDSELRQAVRRVAAQNVPGQRLHLRSLLFAMRFLQQNGVVEQAGGQIRMLAPERFLLNGDVSPVERLGSGELRLLAIDRRQVVQNPADQRVIWPQSLFG